MSISPNLYLFFCISDSDELPSTFVKKVKKGCTLSCKNIFLKVKNIEFKKKLAFIFVVFIKIYLHVN